MGVPKFYRWISERYPCLSEVVKEHQIPEFDNLYLDMNGIIHQCSHPNDEDVHFRISEEKIFADIFHYLEVLFRIIKPRKVFFMAVDGVAPRAKMNQQRGRRFRVCW
uniref:5'-3' exoribonuclease 1 n=1 Tax=Labrus bergylta TaxID=56723 RepID=A0A3Q3G0H2_9LABR